MPDPEDYPPNCPNCSRLVSRIREVNKQRLRAERKLSKLIGRIRDDASRPDAHPDALCLGWALGLLDPDTP